MYMYHWGYSMISHLSIYIYIYIRLTFACKDKCLWRTSQQTIRWRCPDAESFRSENPDVAAVQNDCPSKIGWASFCELREHTILPLLNRVTNWLTFLLVHLKSFQHGHSPFWHGQNLRELWQLWVSHLARHSQRWTESPRPIWTSSSIGWCESFPEVHCFNGNSLGNPVMRYLGLNFPQKCTEMQSMQSCEQLKLLMLGPFRSTLQATFERRTRSNWAFFNMRFLNILDGL